MFAAIAGPPCRPTSLAAGAMVLVGRRRVHSGTQNGLVVFALLASPGHAVRSVVRG
jgi:hypothetical protein